MPKIIPFKAMLSAKDKVALVTSRAYEDYSIAELASQLDYNPYSFLHVINPFYLNQQKVDAEKRLLQVNSKYKEFKTEKILQKENSDSFFLHKIVTKTNTFIGIVGGLVVEEYKQNKIKKHEDTFGYRVDLFRSEEHTSELQSRPHLVCRLLLAKK